MKTEFTTFVLLALITVSCKSKSERVYQTNPDDNHTYLNCPDDHHPHLIDLGLPSGTLWSCCNVGADAPNSYGGYYAWGETAEKDVYYSSTYIHCDGLSYHDLGSDIAGTQYDVAHMEWIGDWQMPTKEQFEELIANCTYEWTEEKGVKGGKFSSKTNGGAIFLPAMGYRWGDELSPGSHGDYWTSSQNPTYSDSAYFLCFDSGGVYWNSYYRYYGQSVRPVAN